MEHWDGVQWSVDASPAPATSDYPRGVAADRPDDAWIVVEADDAAPAYTAHAFVEHWDGASWSIVPSPNADESTGALNS